MNSAVKTIKIAIDTLIYFRALGVEDATVYFELSMPRLISCTRWDEELTSRCAELDSTLLGFPRPNIVFAYQWPVHSRRINFWLQEMKVWFPNLGDRRLLRIGFRPSGLSCRNLQQLPTYNGLTASLGSAIFHEDSANCLVYSPDGKWLATGSSDCTIILWTSKGRLVHEWLAHVQPVGSLAFSHDSRRLASIGRDEKLTIWDISQDVRKLVTLDVDGNAHENIHCAWSPDDSMIVSGDGDGTVRIWDARTFQLLHLLPSEEQAVLDIRFSPDGCWLAVAGYGYCRMQDITSDAAHTNPWVEPKPTTVSVAFNAQSTLLATAQVWGEIWVWNLETGESLLELNRCASEVHALEFSPDGTLLLAALGDCTVKVWNTDSGAMVVSLEGHTDEVMAACFSPCGKYVASASEDGTVRVWRVSDGLCVSTSSRHRSRALRIAFSPDGNTLSSCAENGSVFHRHQPTVAAPRRRNLIA